jgi:biotin carboxyl carrier protein
MSENAHKIWVTVDGERFLVEVGDLNQRPITVTVEESSFEIDIDQDLDDPASDITISKISLQARPKDRSIPGESVCEVTSPMPGDIVQILVKIGEEVNPGDPVCVLDAMKMKNTIHAPQPGTITEICVQEGQSVDYGAVLIKYR